MGSRRNNVQDFAICIDRLMVNEHLANSLQSNPSLMKKHANVVDGSALLRAAQRFDTTLPR